MRQIKPLLLISFLLVGLNTIALNTMVRAETTLRFDQEVEITEIELAGIGQRGDFVASDGKVLKISALLIPNSNDCQRLQPVCSLVEEIETHLATHYLGKKVFLDSSTAKRDRYDRLHVHLRDDNGIWLQKKLLELGYARVKTTNTEQSALAELLKIEAAARSQNKGIWALKAFSPLSTNKLKEKMDRFQIVEGTILDTANVRGTVYLNFGSNWREDFTIKLTSDARHGFPDKGKGLLDLKGQQVRIRGWLFWENGPMISLYNPGQLEILTVD